MAHYFDIKPPEKKFGQKKHSNQSGSTRKPKSSVGLIFIVMILGFILFFSFINNNKTETVDSQNNSPNSASSLDATSDSASEQETQKTPSNPEASISISPTEISSSEKPNIQITILNGSGEVGAASTAKEELGKNGIEVAKIGNSQNNYSQTIIYYTNVNKSLADKIQETLANNTPKLIEDNALADDENILVVIGE